MTRANGEISPYVKLAIAAVEAYIREGRRIDAPADTPGKISHANAGAFVCLKIDGELRGCIGTIEPTQISLAEEIISNAISAAIRDPRFMPVTERELDELEYSVDVLSPPESINGIEQLDPRKYGVIVESGLRRGLLLPDLEGVDTPEMQVDIARRKAYIGYNEPIKLYRFEVKRYT